MSLYPTLHGGMMKAWYCIHIKATKEDSVCQLLKDLPEVETFCPKIEKRRYLRSKPRLVVENLFPRYVFVKFDAPRYAQTIRYTRGVRRVVGDHTGYPWTVDNAIIDFIKFRTEHGFVGQEASRLCAGDSVRIEEGPLTGFQGIFLDEMNATERVIVLLNTIESQTRVQIKKRMITKM
jgi:transcriptional antiterminator RfaH